MKISRAELRAYWIASITSLMLLAATYLLRGCLSNTSAVLSFLLNTLPNFCTAIILPFAVLLAAYLINPDFLFKNKTKLFYSAMPIITIMFILMEVVRTYGNLHTADTYDMIMSISGMVVCIIIFEAYNKPSAANSHIDI